MRWTLGFAVVALVLAGCAPVINLKNDPYAQQGQPLTLTAKIKPWMTTILNVDVTYAAPTPGAPLNPQGAGIMSVQVPDSATWPDGREVRYTWTVRYGLLGGTQTTTAQGRLVMTHPKPVLRLPADAATGVSTTTLFEWNPVAGAAYYVLHVDKRATNTRVFSAAIPGTNNTIPLESQTEYTWHVYAAFSTGSAGTTVYGADTMSPWHRFTTR